MLFQDHQTLYNGLHEKLVLLIADQEMLQIAMQVGRVFA